MNDGRWTFIRPNGSTIHSYDFDEVWGFRGGVARVRLGERTGYVDREGDYVWYPEE